MSKVTFRVLALCLAVGGPAMAADKTDDVKLACPAGTKQFGGRATMTDRGVFCVKNKTEASLPIAHGPYVSYHPNGQKKAVGQHSDGGQSGLWTFFDANGVKTEEIEFSNGNYDGRRTHFFATGKKQSEDRWAKGMQNGVAVAFAEDGQKVAESEYRNGQLVSAQRFENGQPVSAK
ncbi:hypothetical protein OV208_09020 [Corallococcus sp. bb12-1]|uniref:toxin-antitoxin system YwqK family antitoxin n=1 Tax=Corallococcus sp. bb12-1 TaxID=2996784 RepID=UPI00226F4372|nr:hypothetical protein [Corallococcus sp. bb12-1]MCY1041453.1 hypothetical protein [Corallococcus sp. bb12-1]